MCDSHNKNVLSPTPTHIMTIPYPLIKIRKYMKGSMQQGHITTYNCKTIGQEQKKQGGTFLQCCFELVKFSSRNVWLYRLLRTEPRLWNKNKKNKKTKNKTYYYISMKNELCTVILHFVAQWKIIFLASCNIIFQSAIKMILYKTKCDIYFIIYILCYLWSYLSKQIPPISDFEKFEKSWNFHQKKMNSIGTMQ